MNFDNEIGDISTRVDFSPLDGASVLITGGTGFVGNWVQMGLRAASLQGVKYGMTAFAKAGFDFWLKNEWCIEKYDYIFHLAPTFCDNTLKHIYRSLPKRVLFASSGAVYHKEPNEYGLGKIEAQNKLLESGLDVVIACMFAFCGPYLRPDNFAVGNFVRNAWCGEPLRVFGKGDTVRSYMYGADLSVWLWKMMLHGDAGSIYTPEKCPIYNVGSCKPTTILELAKKVRDIVNPAVSIEVMNDGFIERAPVYLPDTSKTRQELGVDERYTLEEQITRYAEWMYEEMK